MKLGAQSVAVVTGAASGIGCAVVRELAKRGATIAMIDTDRDGLADVARATARCTPFVCDVRDPDALARAADEIVRSHGRVDLVANNAGVSVAGSVEALTLAQLHHAMDVNYWGVVHGCRAFLPVLRATAADGSPTALCNVLSDFAFFTLPTKSAYAASKHAAHAFTMALAAELAGSGVTVTAVYPGATATALVARGDAVDSEKQAREAAMLARGLAPEKVARRLVRAVERGQRRVLIGRDTRLLDLATRLAPGLAQAAVGRYWRRVPFL